MAVIIVGRRIDVQCSLCRWQVKNWSMILVVHEDMGYRAFVTVTNWYLLRVRVHATIGWIKTDLSDYIDRFSLVLPRETRCCPHPPDFTDD